MLLVATSQKSASTYVHSNAPMTTRMHTRPVSPSLASICRAGPRTTPALAAAACDLPFIERAVLGLVAVEGFTPEEASAVLKMPVRLVEGCLEAALDRLSPIPADMLTARARLG